MGLCQYMTFAFMHPPYLVRILFGLPSLHLFTFLMFFISCMFLFIYLRKGCTFSISECAHAGRYGRIFINVMLRFHWFQSLAMNCD